MLLRLLTLKNTKWLDLVDAPLGDRLNLAAVLCCIAAKNSFANKWIDQTVKVVEIGGVQSGGYL